MQNSPEPEQPPNGPKSKSLSADDAAELSARIAEISAAGLPLAPGLRAAAAELSEGRLAATMRELATRLDRGESLESVIADLQSRLPSSLRGLIAAGLRTGRLGEVLEQYVDFRQFVADLRRSVWLALAYPLLLLVLTAAIFFFLIVELMPLMAKIYYQSDLTWIYQPWRPKVKLPDLGGLRFLHALYVMYPSCLAAAAAVIVLLALFCRFGRPAHVCWVLNRIPGIGPLWRYSGLAEFTRLLRLLVAHGIPLPEALRLSADGIGDADVAVGARRLAARVEAGQTLAAALNGLSQFASSESSILTWGETQGALPASLDLITDTCVRRLRIWHELLRGTVPVVMLLVVAMAVLTVVSFLRFLLYSLLTMMSGSITSFYIPVLPIMEFGAPAGIFSLLIIGIALLIAVRLIYSGRQTGDTLYVVLQILARLILVGAIYGFFLMMAGFLGYVLALGGLVVWAIVVYRLRRAQQQMLVDLIALSTTRGVPLGPVVHGFAEEQPGAIGRRAARFAARLDRGYPLADAVVATWRLLPPQDQLAIEVGQQTESLPITLQSIASESVGPEDYKESIFIGAIGPVAVGTLGLACVTFVAFQIVPSFERIFKDFNAKLPPLTKQLFAILDHIDVPALVLIPSIAGVVAIVAFYFVLYEMGWVRLELPILNRLFAARHSALLLRWFAAAVRREQPLWPVVDAAAARYPNRLIRRRLRAAAWQIEHGADWVTTFRRRRLIGRRDSAVIRAASRAGNLAWALDEAAAAARRRVAYLMQTLSQILMPLAILLIGGCVMLFVVGCFLPLVTLIMKLAQ